MELRTEDLMLISSQLSTQYKPGTSQFSTTALHCLINSESLHLFSLGSKTCQKPGIGPR